jgi:hypothetical protein
LFGVLFSKKYSPQRRKNAKIKTAVKKTLRSFVYFVVKILRASFVAKKQKALAFLRVLKKNCKRCEAGGTKHADDGIQKLSQRAPWYNG